MTGIIDSMVLASDGRATLSLALKTLFVFGGGAGVSRWKVTPAGEKIHTYDLNPVSADTLTLLWGGDEGTPLPAPLKDTEAIADTVLGWLGTVEYPNISKYSDVNYSRGWKLHAHCGQAYAVCTITPHWTQYHK